MDQDPAAKGPAQISPIQIKFKKNIQSFRERVQGKQLTSAEK